MNTASALPMNGAACCNLRMLHGPALGTAIANAMKLKAERLAVTKITQAAFAPARRLFCVRSGACGNIFAQI